ncbi:MAG: hypothetical protein ACP5PA_03920 [Elusimicrobiales bacterium]
MTNLKNIREILEIYPDNEKILKLKELTVKKSQFRLFLTKHVIILRFISELTGKASMVDDVRRNYR